MASLAAYNGAVLTGSFAEFDQAATADQANAAAVMTQYEEAVSHLAQPWEQPPPPQVSKGNALAAEQSGAGRIRRRRWLRRGRRGRWRGAARCRWHR